MSNKDEASQESAAPKRSSIADLMGVPPLGFVRGGTATSASENMFKQRYLEAEQRRDEADRDRQMARKPITEGGGKEDVCQFTDHPEVPKAYILLDYVNRNGTPIVIGGQPVQCCSDIIVGADPFLPTEVSLIIVCPRCMQQGQKHEQDCQLTIRQSNKRFHLQAAQGPPTFMFQGEVLPSAGVITASEAFSCPDCNWRARIDNNRVWPD